VVKPYSSVTCTGVPFVHKLSGNRKHIYPSQFCYEGLSQHLVGDALFNEAPITKAVNKAITKALDYGDLLLAVTVIEAKTTFRMIASIFRRLYEFLWNLYKAAKRFDIKRIYDVMSDAWLEARYGWRPLYGDIENFAKWLALKNRGFIRSAYGATSQDIDPINFVHHGELKDGLASVKYITAYEVTKVTRKAGFNFEHLRASRNDSTLAQLGLDVQSIASTAWDLIPFSFVIDFFINVSGFIRTFNWEDEVRNYNGYLTSIFSFKSVTYVERTGIIRTEDADMETELLNFLDHSNTAVGIRPAGYPPLRMFLDNDASASTHVVYIDERDMYKKVPDLVTYKFGQQVTFRDEEFFQDLFVRVGASAKPYWYHNQYTQPVTGYIYDVIDLPYHVKMNGLKRSIIDRHFIPAHEFILPYELQREVDAINAQYQHARDLFEIDSSDPEGWDIWRKAADNASNLFGREPLVRATMSWNSFHGILERRYKTKYLLYGKYTAYIYFRRAIYHEQHENKRQGYISYGEFLHRQSFNDFNYKLVRNTDINMGQATDLVILAQRLIESILSTKNKRLKR
jgi:hypothetical protein